MLHFEKELYHKLPLQLISKINKTKTGIFRKIGSPLDGLSAQMKSRLRDFEINFEYDRISSIRRHLDVGQYHNKVSFLHNGELITFENLYLSQHGPPKFKGSVDFFYKYGFSKKKKFYYRLIIPLKEKFYFHFQIEELTILSDLGYRTRLATKAIINEIDVYAYTIHDEKSQEYFVIESESLQDYDSFNDKAFAVKKAIGYLTGYLPGDKGYFFAYAKNEMKTPLYYYVSALRPVIDSSYSPINNNPFAYLKENRKVAERYFSKQTLRVVNIREFSCLCQRLHDSLEFSSAVLLILESSIATLLFMPGGYAIALETLSDIIMDEDKVKLAPIKDKKISALIRKECKEVIERYSGSIDPDDLKVLNGRIEQINQTTNKARLRAPFIKLGLVLLPKDLELLETRNDFLHGRIPDITNAGEDRSVDRMDRDLYYAAVRFYTLLNTLILKWVGFDNYVINYPKINESYCKIKVNEKHYRKI